MPASQTPPIVLSFAASDPTGGAGIQADLLTLAAMGCHPLSVITAVTAQDTNGVHTIHALDARWVEEQASALLADMRVAAFKVGFVGSRANIGAIAAVVADHPGVPLVLDPVLASGRGDPMASEAMLDALRETLLPLTTVLTPNSIEARRLAGRQEREPLAECAGRLAALGCEYVLITGTHEDTPQVINTLFDARGEVRSDAWERLPGSYHGSGCTLASAIAARLASGLPVPQAVREAQEYAWHSLESGFAPGRGQFIPDRLFWARTLGQERKTP